jgi:hypothetical protein
MGRPNQLAGPLLFPVVELTNTHESSLFRFTKTVVTFFVVIGRISCSRSLPFVPFSSNHAYRQSNLGTDKRHYQCTFLRRHQDCTHRCFLPQGRYLSVFLISSTLDLTSTSELPLDHAATTLDQGSFNHHHNGTQDICRHCAACRLTTIPAFLCLQDLFCRT